MKTALQRSLCQHPRVYLRLLNVLGRGSLEKKIFLRLLRRGDVIFDIGANRGYFTRLFSDIAGYGGFVHAFEPVPSTFEILRSETARSGGCKNFTLNNFALGESDGVVTLHLPDADDGQASMRTHTGGSWRNPAAVNRHDCRVTTLDNYAAKIPRLDFVKCDVEGAELLVIKGARGTLDRLSPILFLETNPDWTKAFGYTPDDLVNLLRAHGYDTFFHACDKLAPLANEGFLGSSNLLCAKSTTHAMRLRQLEKI
jgi:FkbM family methyltransferase